MIFEKSNKSKVNDLRRVAAEVYKMREVVSKFSDAEIKAEALKLKKEIAKLDEDDIDEKLPFAYALAIEAIKRSSSFGFELTENQIIGAIAINDEKISEMATGEGKTVTAILPAFLNALTGNSTYIVTPNEYLAKRDAKKTEEVFSMLGMTVGVNLGNVGISQKKEAYKSDIMYSTCTELGFDYLRDNCALSASERVQPQDVFDSFLIIDEADSIMLDEANIPLVLSSSPTSLNSNSSSISSEVIKKMKIVQKFVSILNENDYEISDNRNSIYLSQDGMTKAEAFFGFKNYAGDGASFMYYINNALVANYLFERNKDYIVLDSNEKVTEGTDPNGSIILIDRNTQRRAKGKEYTEGYQQALLIKEGIENINKKSITLGKICIQHFIRSFDKFAGMTGTAMTDAEEFKSVYGTDVVSIPKLNPKRVDDKVDLVYRTRDEKIDAIIQRVIECNKKGQPVLVGTITIHQSEILARAFDAAGIKYNLLNATVTNEREIEIIAQAGRKGAITIATDMAGRGTDINLGGNPEFMTKQKMRKENYSEDEINFAMSGQTSTDERLIQASKVYNQYHKYFSEVVEREKQEVIEAGGLHIIGTEKHISRRNDNQLRGRAGRQGDVGSTEFIISMEDEFIKLNNQNNKLSKFAELCRLSKNGFVKNEDFSRVIEKYQIMMEYRNSDRRASSLKYENVLTDQRRKTYEMRNKIRNGKLTGNFDNFYKTLNNTIYNIVEPIFDEYDYLDSSACELINEKLEKVMVPKNTNLVTPKFVGKINSASQLSKKITKQFTEIFNFNLRQICKIYIEKNNLGVKEEDLMPYVANDVLNICAVNMLKQSNVAWSDQIENLENLKETSSLVAFAGGNVMQKYMEDAYDVFDEECATIFEAGFKYFISGNDTLSELDKIPGYNRRLYSYALKIKGEKQKNTDEPKRFKIIMPE